LGHGPRGASRAPHGSGEDPRSTPDRGTVLRRLASDLQPRGPSPGRGSGGGALRVWETQIISARPLGPGRVDFLLNFLWINKRHRIPALTASGVIVGAQVARSRFPPSGGADLLGGLSWLREGEGERMVWRRGPAPGSGGAGGRGGPSPAPGHVCGVPPRPRLPRLPDRLRTPGGAPPPPHPLGPPVPSGPQPPMGSCARGSVTADEGNSQEWRLGENTQNLEVQGISIVPARQVARPLENKKLN